MKPWKNELGRVLRLKHHQLLPSFFLRRDVGNRAKSPSVFRSFPTWNLAHQAGIHQRASASTTEKVDAVIFKGFIDWRPPEGKRASCTSDYCTGTFPESQRKVEGTATSKSMFTTVWSGHQIDIDKTTALRLNNSEKPPFLWTRERSCLGIPVPWDNISWKLTPRSISSSIKPHSGIKSCIFVDHLHDPQPEFCYKSKTHRHRKEKFAVRGDGEHRIRRHGEPIRVCNSVWTKFVSPTVRSTLVFPYNSYR